MNPFRSPIIEEPPSEAFAVIAVMLLTIALTIVLGIAFK